MAIKDKNEESKNDDCSFDQEDISDEPNDVIPTYRKRTNSILQGTEATNLYKRSATDKHTQNTQFRNSLKENCEQLKVFKRYSTMTMSLKEILTLKKRISTDEIH